MRGVGVIRLNLFYFISLSIGLLACESQAPVTIDSSASRQGIESDLGIDTGNAIDFQLLVTVDGEPSGSDVQVELDSELGCRLSIDGDASDLEVTTYLDVYRARRDLLVASIDVTDLGVLVSEIDFDSGAAAAVQAASSNPRFETQCRALVWNSRLDEETEVLSERTRFSLSIANSSGETHEAVDATPVTQIGF